MKFCCCLAAAIPICQSACSESSGSGATSDFSKAVVLTTGTEPRTIKAGQFLQFEIARRTGISLDQSVSIPGNTIPVIALGKADHFPIPYALPAGMSVPEKAEGFAVWVDSARKGAPTAYLIGRDDKGVLFAAGFLRCKMCLANSFVHISDSLKEASAPEYPLRGQQIIDSTQFKDGFVDWKDTATVQQYIRDLTLFGNNTIEPRKTDGIDVFCEDLGLDLAYTVNCSDIIGLNALSDDQIRSKYAGVTGIDQFVTYGGDHAGARPPREVFPAMERVVPLVLQKHPRASWWYSNQCIEDHAVDYDDYIFKYLQTRQPPWLHGLIYGPWTKRGIPEVRAALPSQYRLRHYPEICHVRGCMYPVPNWAQVWAQVWDRNASIYAMPKMMRDLHNASCRDTIGSTAYNHTGSYNDLNKMVFAALAWNPERDLKEVVRDYARAFFAHQFVYPKPSQALIEEASEKVCQALLHLEDNWIGPLAQNSGPARALKEWKEIVTMVGGPAKVRNNWRLELFLTKAFIDAQVKRKYDLEMQCQQEAYDALRQASTVGLSTTVAQTRSALARMDKEFQSSPDFLKEMQSWGVSGKYGDLSKTLDNLYRSLSDRGWLQVQLDRVKSLPDIERILNYEDAGPGGFYDDLGVEGRQPHLVRQRTWKEDPGFVHSPIEWIDHDSGTKRRQSQRSHAVARYNTPLVMRWEGLDPKAPYYMEVVYMGPFNPVFRCDTDDGFQIHGPRGNSKETPVKYKIPPASTKDGVLQLEWRVVNATRGVSVTEIWLKKDSL